MDINHARTFLAIVAHGSFVKAAEHLHVTQSTVSARMRSLEAELAAPLFVRNRAGAQLTAAGRRFVRHAKALVMTADQAREDVGLPGSYRATVRVGARIALWDDLLPRWVAWLREQAGDVAIRGEIGFEERLMSRLVEGTLDIGIMYTPRHQPGLVVEQLFDDTLVLVGTASDARADKDDYIYVDWSPGFAAIHRERCPALENPPQSVNIGWLGLQIILARGGSCFLPARMARPLLERGLLHRVPDSPEISHPAYIVHARDASSDAVVVAVDGLRRLAREDV